MANNSIIINLDSLVEKLNKLADPIEAVNQGIEKACQMVENTAKENCPVDTGVLRGSITHEVKDGQGTVGTNVEYAEYVEFGTSKMAAQPYLYPALAAHEAAIPEIVYEEIKKTLD